MFNLQTGSAKGGWPEAGSEQSWTGVFLKKITGFKISTLCIQEQTYSLNMLNHREWQHGFLVFLVLPVFPHAHIVTILRSCNPDLSPASLNIEMTMMVTVFWDRRTHKAKVWDLRPIQCFQQHLPQGC